MTGFTGKQLGRLSRVNVSPVKDAVTFSAQVVLNL